MKEEATSGFIGFSSPLDFFHSLVGAKNWVFNGFTAFIAGLASHFRDLLVCKNPATLSLLEVSEQTQQEFAVQAQKASQEFLLQGISIANECDLKYKVSQNQRLFVELTLMQLASLTHDAEKKKLSII
jgi:DNA polymerase-3 subunit gamma/tau